MFIYFRSNTWFSAENIVKLGFTDDLLAEDKICSEYEVVLGEFVIVYQINNINGTKITKRKMEFLINILKMKIRRYKKFFNSGDNFYDDNILNVIDDIFLNIFSDIDVECVKHNSIKNNNVEIQKKYFKKWVSNCIKPLSHQRDILNIIEQFYFDNDKGQLLWACGLGKALMSLFIIQKMGFKNICIGVPNKNLQQQFVREILKIFKKPNTINIVLLNKSNRDIQFDINKINFVITTYNSCHKLVDKQFDFKIGDECHHLVNFKENEKEKSWVQFHNIKSTKTLFMTATIRNLEDVKKGYTMCDENTFGKIIDSKTFKWAIDNAKITDYNVCVIKNNDNLVDEIMSKFDNSEIRLLKGNLILDYNTKDIFMSCFVALKSFVENKDISHMLLYFNTKEECSLGDYFLELIIKKKILKLNDEIYHNYLTSDNSKEELEDELQLFKQSKFGIISCVYLFGEGFDLPKLNAVCFGCNMSSEIRIVQYTMRANRLDKENVNKIAYYIIPYIDSDNWSNVEENKKAFDKIKNIIYQIGNVDELVEQKLYDNYYVKIPKSPNSKKDDVLNDEPKNDINLDNIETIGDLDLLKLKLRHSKSLMDGKKLSKKDLYNHYRIINHKKGIKFVKEYLQLITKNNYMNDNIFELEYLDDPKQYFFDNFKDNVYKGFYHFLNIDTSKYIQNKREFITFCKKKGINHINYKQESVKYNELPEEPEYMYYDLTNLEFELPVKKLLLK